MSIGERTRLGQLWLRLGIPANYVRARRLPLHPEAGRLVNAGRSPAGRPVRLTPRAAAAWKIMQAAARRDGIELLPISGFRSIAKQSGLFRAKLSRGERTLAILRVLAAPGCSEHHTGRALDLGCPGCTELTKGFGRTRAFRWLKAHAVQFGFRLSYPRRNPHGISYEPWHWYYVGRGQDMAL